MCMQIYETSYHLIWNFPSVIFFRPTPIDQTERKLAVQKSLIRQIPGQKRKSIPRLYKAKRDAHVRSRTSKNMPKSKKIIIKKKIPNRRKVYKNERKMLKSISKAKRTKKRDSMLRAQKRDRTKDRKRTKAMKRRELNIMKAVSSRRAFKNESK